jgi:hypothetical protein
LRAFTIKAAVPKVALMDAGLAWLFDVMGEAVQAVARRPNAGRKRAPHHD